TLPHSVPGLRLERALTAALRRAGGVVQVGSWVRLVPAAGAVEWVELEAPAHRLRIPAPRVVLASGGLAGGGLEVTPTGTVRETVTGLEVSPGSSPELFGRSFLEPAGHGIGRAGMRVDGGMRPVGEGGEPIHRDVFAAGGVLACADRAVERSADGICCATGWRAGVAAAR